MLGYNLIIKPYNLNYSEKVSADEAMKGGITD